MLFNLKRFMPLMRNYIKHENFNRNWLHFENKEVTFCNDTEGFAQNGIACYSIF